MGDRLLERRPAQRLIARLPPPFNRKIVEPSLCEMMRNDLWLSRRALWVVAQEFSGAAVQRLPPALKLTIVGRVLNQRMLEAIGGLRWSALDEQNVGVGEPIQ